jgi:hypothetical protein
LLFSVAAIPWVAVKQVDAALIYLERFASEDEAHHFVGQLRDDYEEEFSKFGQFATCSRL